MKSSLCSGSVSTGTILPYVTFGNFSVPAAERSDYAEKLEVNVFCLASTLTHTHTHTHTHTMRSSTQARKRRNILRSKILSHGLH